MQDYEKTLLLKVSISHQNKDYISFTILCTGLYIKGIYFLIFRRLYRVKRLLGYIRIIHFPEVIFSKIICPKKRYHTNMILSLFMIHKRSIKSCHSVSSAFDQG